MFSKNELEVHFLSDGAILINPLKFTDPSGYYPKELGNHPTPAFSGYNLDQLILSEGGFGGGGSYYYTKMFGRGDITYNWYSGNYQYDNGEIATYDQAMNQLYDGANVDIGTTLEWGYHFAKGQGWAGTFDDFITLYNQRTANSSYNGKFTLHTFESFFVPLGTGSKATSEINILLESGLVSNTDEFNLGIPFGVFGAAISIGTEYADNKVRTSFKTGRNPFSWSKLTSKQKAWRTAKILGKNAKFVKYAKGVGVFGTGISIGMAVNDIRKGEGTFIDYCDLGVGSVSIGAAIFLSSNPVGWFIGAGAGIYFTGRLIYDIYEEAND